MAGPELPRLEVPDGTLVLVEELALGRDRSGNFRWRIADDGSVFSTSNQGPFIVPAEEVASTDPAAHWNASWPSQPQQRLDPDAVAEVRAALADVDLEGGRSRPPAPRESHPVVERWTLVQHGATRTLEVPRGRRPADLAAIADAVTAGSLRQQAPPNEGVNGAGS